MSFAAGQIAGLIKDLAMLFGRTVPEIAGSTPTAIPSLLKPLDIVAGSALWTARLPIRAGAAIVSIPVVGPVLGLSAAGAAALGGIALTSGGKSSRDKAMVPELEEMRAQGAVDQQFLNQFAAEEAMNERLLQTQFGRMQVGQQEIGTSFQSETQPTPKNCVKCSDSVAAGQVVVSESQQASI